jgi:hypothetical protein
MVGRHSADWLIRSPQLPHYCAEEPGLSPVTRISSCGEIDTTLTRLPGQQVRALFTDGRRLPWPARLSSVALRALCLVIGHGLLSARRRGGLRRYLRPTLGKTIFAFVLVAISVLGKVTLLFGLLPGYPLSNALV